MFSTNDPWNIVAQGYANTRGKVFEGFAKAALELTKIDANSHVLDVACGPGTLPMLAHTRCKSIKAIDFAENMVSIFQSDVDKAKIDNIEVCCGDGQALPFANESFDVAFSLFGLMFFPDRAKGYAEIYRTLKPGGEVVISSWAPVADSPGMQVMFGAVRKLNPDIPEPKTMIDSLENDAFFEAELESAGFRNVRIHRVSQDYSIESVDGLWQELVQSSAPIVMLKKNLPAEIWQKREAEALSFLKQSLPQLPTSLSSDAWLGYGQK